MTPDHRAIAAHERLVERLAEEILASSDHEVEDSHPGRGARVVADSLRQRSRRLAALASETEADGRAPPPARGTARDHEEDVP